MKVPGRHTAELITIGDELLKGSVLNSNAKFLGRELTELGFDVKAQGSCPDEVEEICERIATAISRSDLVIMSGGLGPTPDDVTRDGVAEFFQVPLVLSKTQYNQITKYYAKRHKVVPELVRREALFPDNAVPLVNRHGIALGFYIVCGSRMIVVLPGVPRELEKMFAHRVKPLALRHFRRVKPKVPFVAKFVGISEPEIMQKLGKGFFREKFEFGIYPHVGEVSIRIYAPRRATVARLKAMVRRRLGSSVYAYEDIKFPEAVGKLLTKSRKTLSAAESCSGGLLSSEITKVSGASKYFKGSIVSYTNAVKEDLLGVSPADLRRYGAVSDDVALQMAEGVRRKLKTTYGIAITGVAGPDGGTRKKPVGLVYIALANGKRSRVWQHEFWGDRHQVQQKASMKALEYLWRQLRRDA